MNERGQLILRNRLAVLVFVLLALSFSDARRGSQQKQARKAIRRMAGFELPVALFASTHSSSTSAESAEVSAEIRTVFRFAEL